MSNITNAQELVIREDKNDIISLYFSNSKLQAKPNYCLVRGAAFLSKDTSIENSYILSFIYNTPEEIELDSSVKIEILFMDGKKYVFDNYSQNDEEDLVTTLKDSSAVVFFPVSYECLLKMTKVPVSGISFLTPLYTHRIEIADTMKLVLPNLARKIFESADEEFVTMLLKEQALHAPHIVFDSRGNKQLDKKYLGKYSGEWYKDKLLYKFDLYIKTDTSYIVWGIIKDSTERDAKRIKTQILNIRKVTDDNILIMDVCYEADKPDYTDGRRSFYLKLSENGIVLYGKSTLYDQVYGEMYGIKNMKLK